MGQPQPPVNQILDLPSPPASVLLHTIISGIADPVFVKDRQHRWAWVNEAFCQLLGCSATELMGHSTYDCLSATEAERLREQDEQIFLVGGVHEHEERLMDLWGKTHVLLIKQSCIEDSTGTYLVGIIREITDQVTRSQHTETELRTTNHLLQSILDTIPEAIFWKDRNSVYRGCNQEFATVAGGDCPQQIVHKTDEDLVWQAEAASFRERDRQVMESDTPQLGKIEPQRRADGTEGWIQVNKLPLHDAAGNVIGILGTFQDITQRKQIEDALRQSEATNRALVEAIPELLIQMKRDGTYLDIINRGNFKPFDPINAKVGSNVHNILPPSLAQERMYYTEQALQTGTLQVYDQELMIQGQTCYEEVRIVPNGEDTVLIIIHDVTARKRAELALQHLNEELEKQVEARTAQLKKAIARLEREIRDRRQVEKALRRSQQTLQLVIDTFPQRVFWKDRQFHYLGCNKLFAQDAGLVSPEQIIGQDDFALTWRAQADRLQADDAMVMEHGISKVNCEEAQVREDGTTLWLRTTKIPLKNEAGVVIGLFGAYEDISDRKAAEDALRESETRFRQLAENIAGYFWLLADNGQYLYVSPGYEKIWGYSSNALYQDSADWLSALHPDDRDRVLAADARQWEAGYDLEYRMVRPDGSIRWIRDRAFPVRNQEGAIYRMAGIADDVTDRKQAEEALQASEARLRQQAEDLEKTLHELRRAQAQLVQSEKMSSLGQLVAGVAHEINNPVNFIYGNLKYAREYIESLLGVIHLYQTQYPDPTPAIQAEAEAIDLEFLIADLPQLLQSMKVGAERIQEIVTSLRTFSRMDEADMKVVDIHAGIDSTLMILQNRLRAHSSRSEIYVMKEYGDLPLVECYAGQLNQVFMNILSNAIDALEAQELNASFSSAEEPLPDSDFPPPTIRICTELLHANQVLIRIADNGAGMPEEVKQRLFDPFFTTKPIGKGTGMGLSISYQIVTERHGGSIICQSEAGQGTEFVITIPLRQKSALVI